MKAKLVRESLNEYVIPEDYNKEFGDDEERKEFLKNRKPGYETTEKRWDRENSDFVDIKTSSKEQNKRLKVYALSIGVVTISNGKTMYDWSIYDHPDAEIYLIDWYFLYGAPGSLKIGDKVQVILNDTKHPKPLRGKTEVVDIAKCNKEDVLTMLKRNGYDYYPVKPFQKVNLSRRKLLTSYAIKGIE